MSPESIDTLKVELNALRESLESRLGQMHTDLREVQHALSALVEFKAWIEHHEKISAGMQEQINALVARNRSDLEEVNKRLRAVERDNDRSHTSARIHSRGQEWLLRAVIGALLSVPLAFVLARALGGGEP
jgi:hypothetical protein